MIIKKLSINCDINKIICELKGNEHVNLQNVEDFINLFEYFLTPKKEKDINNKNEINDIKNINMNAIRKINFANSDNIKDCLNIINDNKNMKNI